VVDPRTETRLKILILALGICWSALLVFLWYIQVVRGAEYEELSTGNRTRQVRLPAPRGRIYDRGGTVIADNRPGMELFVNLPEVIDRERLVSKLAAILELDPAEVRRRLAAFRERPYEPVRVATDIGLEKAVAIWEQAPLLEGVVVQANPLRNYPLGEETGHLTGYTGQISPQELERLQDEGYHPQDDIGKAGIEEAFDRELKGVPGRLRLQVDARGYRDRALERVAPVPGNDLHLTVDARAQEILEDLMRDYTGAAVAMDPRNGDILALVSKPGFDPNRLVRPVDAAYLSEIFADPRAPLVNRVISGEYPPGSPFKLVVALAGLTWGGIDPEKRVECNGFIQIGEGTFRCWKPGGHGEVNLEEAIKGSCNVYFYRLGLEMGADRLRRMAMMLGMGRRSGIVLMGEKSGLLPGKTWKRQVFGEPWYPGDTANFSIGQGFLLVTPVQMAVFCSAIANRGTVYRPRLVTEVTSPRGEIVAVYPPETAMETLIPPQAWERVARGMYRVVNDPGGSGRAAAQPEIAVAGKTGTAQVGRPPDYEDTAWFICFAPFEAPRVVLVLLLERAGSGGHQAAPLAGQFIRRFFRLPAPENREGAP